MVFTLGFILGLCLIALGIFSFAIEIDTNGTKFNSTLANLSAIGLGLVLCIIMYNMSQNPLPIATTYYKIVNDDSYEYYMKCNDVYFDAEDYCSVIKYRQIKNINNKEIKSDWRTIDE